jgi:hypothetical protein
MLTPLAPLNGFKIVEADALLTHLLGLTHLDVGIFTGESFDTLLFGPVVLLLPLLLFLACAGLAGVFVLLLLGAALLLGSLVHGSARYALGEDSIPNCRNQRYGTQKDTLYDLATSRC